MKIAGRDYSTPQLLLGTLSVVLIVAVIIAASTTTTAFGVYNSAWNGASGLSKQANAVNASSDVILKTSAYTTTNPNQTVAFILSPKTRYNSSDRARLKQFVSNGGTLVIANDFGSHGNGLLKATGATARFNGQVVRDERHNYRSPAFPKATNVSNSSLTNNVTALTLNYGTTLKPNNATPLVRTSEFAYLDTNGNEQLDDNENMTSRPVVTIESVGKGHVIAVSDPSIFINAMLKRPGNQQFAQNIISGHSHVLLDYSHAGSQPPLAVALLLLRRTPLAQALLGTGGLLLAVSWSVWTSLFGSVLTSRGKKNIHTRSVDEEVLMDHLRERHPDWEEERLQRVVTGIVKKQQE